MQLTGRTHRLGTVRCQRKPLGVFQGQPLCPRGRRPRKPLGAEPIYLHGQSAAGVQLASNFYVAAGSSTTYDASTDQNIDYKLQRKPNKTTRHTDRHTHRQKVGLLYTQKPPQIFPRARLFEVLRQENPLVSFCSMHCTGGFNYLIDQ